MVAITASIQHLVTQLLANGNITNTTTSIKEAIEASATSNAAAIGAIGLSATDTDASAKLTADDTMSHVKPTPKISLHPGAHDANKTID